VTARTRTVTDRVRTIALALLAVSGWGAFGYSSWSAARTERALQSRIARPSPDREATAGAPRQDGQPAARAVYPAPYGTGAPAQAAVTPAATGQQPSPAAKGTVVAEQAAPPREPSVLSATPQSSAPPLTATEAGLKTAQDDGRLGGAAPGGDDARLVDINTASVDELNRLGGRFGRAIVAGRPYASIDELVSKRILTRATFGQIREQITTN